MTTYVSFELRRLVSERARGCCEYCLIHESDTYLGCQVDHIVSEKHGGATTAENLCYACAFCNRSKGTDIGSRLARTGKYYRFFNPRTDRWLDHFLLMGTEIHGRTPIGEVTASLLRFNQVERRLEREALLKIGRYPTMP